jgi:hypothetical protein
VTAAAASGYFVVVQVMDQSRIGTEGVRKEKAGEFDSECLYVCVFCE